MYVIHLTFYIKHVQTVRKLVNDGSFKPDNYLSFHKFTEVDETKHFLFQCPYEWNNCNG